MDSGDHVIPEYEAGRLEAIVITGDKPLEGGERDKTAFVKELLSPLSPRNVTLVRHIATQSNDPDREGRLLIAQGEVRDRSNNEGRRQTVRWP